jgi:hypothetical protein
LWIYLWGVKGRAARMLWSRAIMRLISRDILIEAVVYSAIRIAIISLVLAVVSSVGAFQTGCNLFFGIMGALLMYFYLEEEV